jgi:hypothetical protein
MRIGSTLAMMGLCIAFGPLTATAGEDEDRGACINDALTVCSDFIPDRERVAHCLISNRDRISEPCRTALTHFDRPAPAKVAAVKHPAASRTKVAAGKHPAASRAKVAAGKHPATSRTKVTTVKHPAASRAKVTAAKHSAAPRGQLTAIH